MAGIYIHIPFCRQACHYCNFHFSTTLNSRSDVVTAIISELDKRHTYLQNRSLDTIYFGGGTPSVLTADEIASILKGISKHFDYDEATEITLEANPEDLTDEYLKQLKTIGINRLSIGVQSFHDEDLKFMNRSHNAKQAKDSILRSLEIFDDISIDLIFGGQYSSAANWTHNLKTAISLGADHVSSYSLTIEDGTAFGNWIDKNKLQPIEDDKQKNQFLETIDTLTDAGYEHYEISNYAKAGKYARHNTNYWKNETYLGLGPSAHSYDGVSRQWNIANNHKYLEGVLKNENYFTLEELSQQDKYNEYILTSLRTMWGCERTALNIFDPTYQEHFDKSIVSIIAEHKAKLEDGVLYLTREGKLFADQVAEELFFLN